MGKELLLPTTILSLCFYTWVLVKIYKLRHVSKLPDMAGETGSSAKVTTVIAARNEAMSLISCLTSIVKQESVDRVIFVDDHSTDNTLELAKKQTSSNARIEVLSAPPIPAGWVGKTHALDYGARAATTKYILFTDADVLISPFTTRDAARFMEKEQLDHLSGNFYIHCIGSAEHICAPVLAASSAIALFNAAKTKGSATGAFNMINTDFYRRIGGHRQIKNAIIDDVCLARLVKSNGGRTAFVDLSGRVALRLFQGTTGFFALVARAAQPYLGERFVLPFFGGLVIASIGFFTGLGPFFISGLFFRAQVFYNMWSAVVVVLLGVNYTLGLICCFGVRRFHDGKAIYAVFYPFALIMLGLATFYSNLVKLLGLGISWRGRKYPST